MHNGNRGRERDGIMELQEDRKRERSTVEIEEGRERKNKEMERWNNGAPGRHV